MKNYLRLMLSSVVLLLPSSLRIIYLRRIMRHNVAQGCRVGRSLILCDRLVMESGASIGSFTVIKDLAELHMGREASIGNLNWITSIKEKSWGTAGGARKLSLGEHSAITNRHYLDVQAAITLGAYSTIAGVRSALWTHGINIAVPRQECAPISIGRYCLVGSGGMILAGANVGDFCVIAAGSVVPRGDYFGPSLYAGVPARKIKDIDPRSGYFTRTDGVVR